MNPGAGVCLYCLDALLGGKRSEKLIGLVAFHQVNPSLHWQILVPVICLNVLRPSNRTMLKPWQRETRSDPGVYVLAYLFLTLLPSLLTFWSRNFTFKF